VYLSEQTIPNVSALELFQYPETEFLQYHGILKHIRPKFETGKLKATSLMELSFETVEIIKLKCSKRDLQSLTEAMELVFDVPKETLLKLKCYDFYSLYNWFISSINTLIERENKVFTPTSSNANWDTVKGSERLKKFGMNNTTIPLAQKFGKTPEQIKVMKYIDVFTAKLYFKELQDISSEIQKLEEAKRKAQR
jgi:hypothetical protein